MAMKIRSLLRKTNMENTVTPIRRRKRRWIGHKKSLTLPTSGKEKTERTPEDQLASDDDDEGTYIRRFNTFVSQSKHEIVCLKKGHEI